MEKLIDTSSSFYGTGIQPQGKLFKVGSGQYKNRVLALYPKGPENLVFRWADPPYLFWSDPENLISDSADYPCTGFMDEDGNLYVVYTQKDDFSLGFLKLSFNAGTWSPSSVQTICGVETNYYPGILKDSTGRLWVSWSFYDSSAYRYYVQVKNSVDDGVTWGLGQNDPGTSLTNGETSCFSQLVFLSPHIFCFYSDGGTKLAYRKIELSESIWESEEEVYSSSDIDSDFYASVSADKRIGIVFPGAASLLYKEYDGNSWSGLFTADWALPVSPTLKFLEEVPYLFYGRNIGEKQNQMFYTRLEGGSFQDPIPLISGAKPFDRVFCYDESASEEYHERTSEAEDTTSADVFHPESSALVKDIDDCLYLGSDFKFNLINMILSTSGIGGEVSWEYWGGEGWSVFVPYSGSYHLDSGQSILLLWVDLLSCPSDWQRCDVYQKNKFWIRIKVKTTFTTAPVGSQITCVPQGKHVNVI
ncbi:MAG: hypothetical protein AMJ90_05010 [candidate division Zixibacteria bacterium SM23_73_2]|nr:MAG: hypothetical protein AMJ90_05010 [candidate division Zixibacteria bacterium SM23_73_2]